MSVHERIGKASSCDFVSGVSGVGQAEQKRQLSIAPAMRWNSDKVLPPAK